MAEIGHEHLHHMAKRLHHANMQVERVTAKVNGIAKKAADTGVTVGSAWLGGALEGVTGGSTVPLINMPWNLFLGLVFTGFSHYTKVSDRIPGGGRQLGNIGEGLLSSWTSAVGYHWGKGWKDSGFKLWGRKSLSAPYSGLGANDVIAGQQLSDAQMYDIMQQMQAAAGNAPRG